MIPKLYRIFLGARNTPNHTFESGDEQVITNVLSRYFKGWTIVNSVGIWEGTEEQSKIISVVVSKTALIEEREIKDPTTGKSHFQSPGKTPVEACAKQLKQHFGQGAVMVEEGGSVSLY